MTATGSPEVMRSFSPFPFPVSSDTNTPSIHLDLPSSPLRMNPSTTKGRVVRVLPPPQLFGMSPRPPLSFSMDISGVQGSGNGSPLSTSTEHPGPSGPVQPRPSLSISMESYGSQGSGNGSPLSTSTEHPGPSGPGFPGPSISLEHGFVESPVDSPGITRRQLPLTNSPTLTTRQRTEERSYSCDSASKPDMFCSFCLLGGFKMKLTITGTGPTKAVFCRKCSREDPPIGSKICTNPTCRQLHMPEDDSRRCTVCSGQLYKKKR